MIISKDFKVSEYHLVQRGCLKITQRILVFLPVEPWGKGDLFRSPSLIDGGEVDYLLLLFHVGTCDAVKSTLRSTKRDYGALGAAVRESGAQIVFSSKRGGD